MKIAIDIDKTIIDCDSRIYSFVNKYFSNQSINKNLSYIPISEAKTKNNLISRLSKKIFSMCKREKYHLYEDSLQAINNLKKQGHNIILLSSRPNISAITTPLLDILSENLLNNDYIYIACTNKIRFCKDNNINLYIDNNEQLCSLARENDIESICFNKKKNLSNQVYFDNWNEIINYIASIE